MCASNVSEQFQREVTRDEIHTDFSPWCHGLQHGGFSGTTAGTIMMVLGGGAIAYSLMTRYELGVFKVIPMPMHLMLDLGSGILLAASPWLFGFAETVYLPHLILGLVEIGAALMTRTTPGMIHTRPTQAPLSPQGR